MGSNPTGPTRILQVFDNFTESGPDGKALVCYTRVLAKRPAGSTPALSSIAEGTAEWPATGPENQGMAMSHGRSIRLPSAKFAQVREPG